MNTTTEFSVITWMLLYSFAFSLPFSCSSTRGDYTMKYYCYTTFCVFVLFTTPFCVCAHGRESWPTVEQRKNQQKLEFSPIFGRILPK